MLLLLMNGPAPVGTKSFSANFLAAYREALDGARDPAGWGNLRRVLRLWSGMVIATNRPGFYEAQEAALAGTGGGMLLEDYVRLRRTQA
jgi:hypothetical protein